MSSTAIRCASDWVFANLRAGEGFTIDGDDSERYRIKMSDTTARIVTEGRCGHIVRRKIQTINPFTAVTPY